MSLGLFPGFVPSPRSVEWGCEKEEEFFRVNKDASVPLSADVLHGMLHPVFGKDDFWLNDWRYNDPAVPGFRGYVLGFVSIPSIPNGNNIIISNIEETKHPNSFTLSDLKVVAQERVVLSDYLCGDPPVGLMLVKLNVLTDTKPPEKYYLPHTCTRCSQPAYITFRNVECSNQKCFCYIKPRAV